MLDDLHPFCSKVSFALKAPLVISPDPMSQTTDVLSNQGVDRLPPRREAVLGQQKRLGSTVVEISYPSHRVSDVELVVMHNYGDHIMQLVTSCLFDVVRVNILVQVSMSTAPLKIVEVLTLAMIIMSVAQTRKVSSVG